MIPEEHSGGTSRMAFRTMIPARAMKPIIEVAVKKAPKQIIMSFAPVLPKVRAVQYGKSSPLEMLLVNYH